MRPRSGAAAISRRTASTSARAGLVERKCGLPAAAAALKPGIFALVDACGDRELGQIHAAFGSQAGGARRVALAALVEEHKRTHKYDGKV